MIGSIVAFLILLAVVALSSSKLASIIFGIVLAVIICLFFGWLGAFAMLIVGGLLWLLSNL